LLCFIGLAFVIPCIVMVIQGIWLGLIILLLTGLLPLSIYANTRYEIRQNQLFITCGFLYKEKINIAQITSIRPSRSILSAPALSLDRQEIKFNKFDAVLISLKDEDKADFYQQLKQINPYIQVL